MKRIIIGLLTAFLLTAGLAAVAPQQASAARCPYNGCLPSGTYLNGPSYARSNQVVTYAASVRTLGSTLVPKGRTRFFVYREGRADKLIMNRIVPIDRDGRRKIVVGKLAPGTYRLQMRYMRKAGTRWQNSRSRIRTLVVRAPR